jgi:putative transposase
MGYLTALARVGLNRNLNYTERNIVEKFFQTYAMRIQRSLLYTPRSHQALDGQPPPEILNQRDPIKQCQQKIHI